MAAMRRDVCNFQLWIALYAKYCHVSKLIVPAFSHCAGVFKEVRFVYFYWNGNASLPTMLWKCIDKWEITALLVALRFILKEVLVISRKLKGYFSWAVREFPLCKGLGGWRTLGRPGISTKVKNTILYPFWWTFLSYSGWVIKIQIF